MCRWSHTIRLKRPICVHQRCELVIFPYKTTLEHSVLSGSIFFVGSPEGGNGLSVIQIVLFRLKTLTAHSEY